MFDMKRFMLNYMKEIVRAIKENPLFVENDSNNCIEEQIYTTDGENSS